MSCHVCKEKANCRCSICKSVWYCSEKCQQKDWPHHMPVCRSPKSNSTYAVLRELYPCKCQRIFVGTSGKRQAPGSLIATDPPTPTPVPVMTTTTLTRLIGLVTSDARLTEITDNNHSIERKLSIVPSLHKEMVERVTTAVWNDPHHPEVDTNFVANNMSALGEWSAKRVAMHFLRHDYTGDSLRLCCMQALDPDLGVYNVGNIDEAAIQFFTNNILTIPGLHGFEAVNGVTYDHVNLTVSEHLMKRDTSGAMVDVVRKLSGSMTVWDEIIANRLFIASALIGGNIATISALCERLQYIFDTGPTPEEDSKHYLDVDILNPWREYIVRRLGLIYGLLTTPFTLLQNMWVLACASGRLDVVQWMAMTQSLPNGRLPNMPAEDFILVPFLKRPKSDEAVLPEMLAAIQAMELPPESERKVLLYSLPVAQRYSHFDVVQYILVLHFDITPVVFANLLMASVENSEPEAMSIFVEGLEPYHIPNTIVPNSTWEVAFMASTGPSFHKLLRLRGTDGINRDAIRHAFLAACGTEDLQTLQRIWSDLPRNIHSQHPAEYVLAVAASKYPGVLSWALQLHGETLTELECFALAKTLMPINLDRETKTLLVKVIKPRYLIEWEKTHHKDLVDCCLSAHKGKIDPEEAIPEIIRWLRKL